MFDSQTQIYKSEALIKNQWYINYYLLPTIVFALIMPYSSFQLPIIPD